MGKGRPAPISSFGAGQGENNISVASCLGTRRTSSSFTLWRLAECFSSAVASDVWSGAHLFARVELDSGVKGGV